MKNRFQSLVIDGVSYSREELMHDVVPSLIQSEEAWRHSIGEFIAQWLDETDSIQVKTSGSTGEPKLISVSKQAMVLSSQKTIQFLGLEPGTRALLCLPASYIAGRMMLVRAFVGQWNLHFVQPNDLFEALGDDSVYDMAALVPLQLEQLLATCTDEKEKVRQLKRISCLRTKLECRMGRAMELGEDGPYYGQVVDRLSTPKAG